jgi:hypothetical protein
MSDATAILLAVAALATTAYVQFGKSELQNQLNQCRIEYQGFKDGVMYGK